MKEREREGESNQRLFAPLSTTGSSTFFKSFKLPKNLFKSKLINQINLTVST
jgi:hypothetical protein